MGPAVYPELEALKAQSIAARTYVVRNLGQYREVGFDICDTPRCQVYHGIDGEHPLTDRAIAETAGLVLAYKGEPINALYTSTCGGHTENVEGVFIQQKSPYLRGVPCYAEKMEVVRVRGDRSQPVILLEDDRLVNAELALMRMLGVLQESDLDPGFFEAAAAPDEIRIWINRLLNMIGRPVPDGERGGEPLRTLRDLNRTLVEDLGWDPRIGLFFREKDMPQLLAYGDGAELDPIEKQRFAYFLHLGIFRPFPDNTLRPDHLPSRGFVLKVLHDVADSYDALSQEDEKFLERESGRYRIGSSLKPVDFRIASDAYLFRQVGGRSLPAEELVLYPGDRVRYHAQEDLVDWLELRNPDRGLSDDRSSPLSRWQVRYSREQLEEILRERFPLGTLEDVEIIDTGVSGRVTEILIRGSRGDFRMRGFRIRSALKIRETLFVVDRQFGLDGSVQDFIFTGRGWGHGVGLCQVGAYGMALRNERYDRILHHYYTGVKIRKNYGSAFSRP
jgi:stage II sporulation protein D